MSLLRHRYPLGVYHKHYPREAHELMELSSGRRRRRSTGSLAVRAPEASGNKNAITELQKRFSALDEVIQEEVEMVSKFSLDMEVPMLTYN